VSIKEKLQEKLNSLEEEMNSPSFWNDKEKAQKTIKEIQEIKDEIAGFGKYDRGNAVMTIFAGAGGDDAEDFVRMLLDIYTKYFNNKNWEYFLMHENKNEQNGYRNITLEVIGKNAYGMLKNESGVHRIVRISPFNANKKRHTSFAMVEVVPKFEKTTDFKIPEKELEISFARSSGPGGQNVNKRDTAVRVKHIPTGISAHIESGRSQADNREKAIALVQAKLYKKLEEEKKAEKEGMHISKTQENEWGNQIRSYVLHPYQMIKDHRTGLEIRDIKRVFDDGEIDAFIEAEREL